MFQYRPILPKSHTPKNCHWISKHYKNLILKKWSIHTAHPKQQVNTKSARNLKHIDWHKNDEVLKPNVPTLGRSPRKSVLFIHDCKNGVTKILTNRIYKIELPSFADSQTQGRDKNSQKEEYHDINIVGYKCPPVKTYEELCQKEFVDDMIQQNADIIWVSLGFPKQEEFIYMLKSKYNIYSNIVGIGAVFEWVAGTKIKAPEWIANIGFEWIFRLIQEPKRLFRRYFIDNFLFIIYFVKQYISK